MEEDLSLSGGMIPLVKVALSNLSVYYMSLLWMLVGIRNKLDRISRDFL